MPVECTRRKGGAEGRSGGARDAPLGPAPRAVYFPVRVPSGDPPRAPRPNPMRLQPLGDRAILIELGDAIDEATHRRVLSVCARLDERPIPGVVDLVPAFTSVTVHYDPGHSARGRTYEVVAGAIGAALRGLDEVEPVDAREVEIPVCYGGECGPDLDALARRHRLAPDEVARIHAAGEYRVHMIGFAPGFPYLAGLDRRIATPRRDTPRTRVPAGSVAIGGRQTGVYPIDSPGGWHLIGRTPLRLFLAEREPPALLRVGDRVRFRSISPEELRDREAAG